MDLDPLQALLEEHGVPCGLIYTAPDMLKDPHFAAREAIVDVPHPVFGTLKMQNVAPRLSGTPGAVRHAAPTSANIPKRFWATFLASRPQRAMNGAPRGSSESRWTTRATCRTGSSRWPTRPTGSVSAAEIARSHRQGRHRRPTRQRRPLARGPDRLAADLKSAIAAVPPIRQRLCRPSSTRSRSWAPISPNRRTRPPA